MNIENARFNMVEQQIRTWDVSDKALLELLSNMNRENFVDKKCKDIAFADLELPLPGGGKMLCPRVEARLIQALKLTKYDNVLEIGSGSGYVTALLAKLSNFVYSVEINARNKELADKNLMNCGITNASVVLADGINGLDTNAPYDKIFVGGALTTINEALKKQLKIGGRLVGFIGYTPTMHAVVINKLTDSEYDMKYLFEIDLDYLVSENMHKFKF